MPSDQKFVDGLLNNNSKIIEEIYRIYLPRVTALIRKKGGTKVEIEDAFQEGLMVVVRLFRKGEFKLHEGNDKFFWLLATICSRLWAKKKSSNPTVIIPPNLEYTIEEDSFEEEVLNQERYQLFKEKIKSLSEVCQQLIHFHLKGVKPKDYYEQLEYKDPKVAAQQSYKCRKKLTELIRNDKRFKKLI